MGAKYTLSDLAKNDLREIGWFTQEKYGRRQRLIYIESLVKSFSLLSENPDVEKYRDDVKAGYKSFPVKKHIIFYRELTGHVEILRIFHESMDYKSVLSNSSKHENSIKFAR